MDEWNSLQLQPFTQRKQFISNKMVSIWTFKSLLFQQLSIALVRNQVGNNQKV